MPPAGPRRVDQPDGHRGPATRHPLPARSARAPTADPVWVTAAAAHRPQSPHRQAVAPPPCDPDRRRPPLRDRHRLGGRKNGYSSCSPSLSRRGSAAGWPTPTTPRSPGIWPGPPSSQRRPTAVSAAPLQAEDALVELLDDRDEVPPRVDRAGPAPARDELQNAHRARLIRHRCPPGLGSTGLDSDGRKEYQHRCCTSLLYSLGADLLMGRSRLAVQAGPSSDLRALRCPLRATCVHRRPRGLTTNEVFVAGRALRSRIWPKRRRFGEVDCGVNLWPAWAVYRGGRKSAWTR